MKWKVIFRNPDKSAIMFGHLWVEMSDIDGVIKKVREIFPDAHINEVMCLPERDM